RSSENGGDNSPSSLNFSGLKATARNLGFVVSPRSDLPPGGPRRVVIDAVRPDPGSYAIKRVVGDRVEVEADLVADGHDQLVGMLDAAAERAGGADGRNLQRVAALLRTPGEGVQAALDPELAALMRKHADRSLATTLEPARTITVDPPLARFGSWYELFPRST